MNLSDFSFSTLGEYSCDLQSFDCGREDINEFFRNDALQYQDELFGKTYLFSPRDNLNQIAAAFTVANASIFTRLLPNSRQKKVGYEVHHSKNQINYPAVLLGRLGVDRRFSGHNLGLQIIEFVAQWFAGDENKSGCRHLIVDAYNENWLLEFYKKCGLNPIFSSEEQERKYRQIEDSKILQTRLLYRDLILLKRTSKHNVK
ncbi:MAG: N-acetyltransferase [Hallerella porci]|uniref:N-acetyltransferase domain-containing protein n=1 Tax=Hallerella porci TaxID=1945871 RepID=A0ABX5LN51_9BACT|nr:MULTISPECIES: N-acetyltransferase [Hallerella]MCI5601011.1 N-acetyltransferase [Hallerella sp.]MDY3920726.1 N-acetyltransferase [Hallerella porci]PWL03836.1 hypothetical protein B0H50_1027 [Hallerella porci]